MKYAQGGKFHIRKPALAMARSNGSHTVAPDPITAKQSAPIRQTLIALHTGDAIHDSYTNSQTRNTKTSRSPTTPRSITPRGGWTTPTIRHPNQGSARAGSRSRELSMTMQGDPMTATQSLAGSKVIGLRNLHRSSRRRSPVRTAMAGSIQDTPRHSVWPPLQVGPRAPSKQPPVIKLCSFSSMLPAPLRGFLDGLPHLHRRLPIQQLAGCRNIHLQRAEQTLHLLTATDDKAQHPQNPGRHR